MNEAKAVYISEIISRAALFFVILTLRFRLTSLNINCHRWSDSQISQRPLKENAGGDYKLLILLNYMSGQETLGKIVAQVKIIFATGSNFCHHE